MKVNLKNRVSTFIQSWHFKYISLSFLLLVLISIFLPQTFHSWDRTCWETWSKHIYSYGLVKVYDCGADYLPLYYYVLEVYNFFQPNLESVVQNINLLKIFTLIFHFISGYFLVELFILNKFSFYKAIFWSLFYLLNLAVLYNAAFWGQVDDIYTCFIFLSVVFCLKKRILLALLCLLISLNFKLQAIIFIPVIGLLLLPQMRKSFNRANLMSWIFIPLTLQILIFLPFIIHGNLPYVFKIALSSVDRYPFITMNAYNIWYFVFSGDLVRISDRQYIWGLTCKDWGHLMFFSLSFIALIPLIKHTFQQWIKKVNNDFPLSKTLLITSLITLLFFYFNTQMHERYVHPSLIFIFSYAVLARKPWIALLAFSAYLLNIDGVLQALNILNYEMFLYSQRFVSFLYLLTITALSWELFQPNRRLKNARTNGRS